MILTINLRLTSLANGSFRGGDCSSPANSVQLARHICYLYPPLGESGVAPPWVLAHTGYAIQLPGNQNGLSIYFPVINTASNRRSDSSQGTGGEKGAGLGLSLCRDYLLKAGGSLTVESLEGKGSTFTIVIPR